jgi:hypothetical protein
MILSNSIKFDSLRAFRYTLHLQMDEESGLAKETLAVAN